MEPNVRFMDRDQLLSPPEYVRLARVCVGLGVNKVRITGGEPTLHPQLPDIIAGVASLGDIDVAITTNGSLTDAAAAAAWKRAGLNRVTISIDGIDDARFAAVTRSATPVATVIAAITAAQRAGFDPVKVNAVIIRGMNDDQVVPSRGLAREHDIDVRFIEFMPLDSGRTWRPDMLVPAAEIIERIAGAYALDPVGRDEDSSTSLNFRFADGAPGRIGVIAPVTRAFCGACSRLRITADGKVRPCLFSLNEWDIRPLLRGGASDDDLADFLIDCTWTKQAGHGISAPGFTQPQRPMSAIGG